MRKPDGDCNRANDHAEHLDGYSSSATSGGAGSCGGAGYRAGTVRPGAGTALAAYHSRARVHRSGNTATGDNGDAGGAERQPDGARCAETPADHHETIHAVCLPAVPEIAYVGGAIHTQDDDRPLAQSLLARGGRIVAVGTTDEVLALASPAVETVDLAGRVVLPGFVDAHCHLELTATHLAYAVHAFGAELGSIERIVDVVRTAAARTPPGEWIVARSDFALHRLVTERRPIVRGDLDAAISDHPCVVFAGLHACTLNTAALRATGLLDGSAVLPRGSAIDLETGRAKELWDWLPLPRYSRDQIANAIRDEGRARWTSRGVTTIAELPFTRAGIGALQDLHRRGELPTRVGLWLHTPLLGSVEQLTGPGYETGFGDEWLSHRGIKLFVDGTGTDIDGNAEADIKWSQVELDHMVRTAHVAGQQLWMHVAPTLAAAEMALLAVQRAQAAYPRADHRHRIEHIGDMRPVPDLLERIRAAGIIVVTTPQFTYSYGDLAPEDACTPLRSLHAMGFRPPGNSDATGTQREALNPWHSIWCAMAHRSQGGASVAPEESIDMAEALRVHTRDAAVACHMDDRGVLSEGRLADLVVLDADPFTTPLDDVPQMPVAMTVIGGVSQPVGQPSPSK